MDRLDRLLDRREPRLHVLEDVTGTLHRALLMSHDHSLDLDVTSRRLTIRNAYQ